MLEKCLLRTVPWNKFQFLDGGMQLKTESRKNKRKRQIPALQRAGVTWRDVACQRDYRYSIERVAHVPDLPPALPRRLTQICDSHTSDTSVCGWWPTLGRATLTRVVCLSSSDVTRRFISAVSGVTSSNESVVRMCKEKRREGNKTKIR